MKLINQISYWIEKVIDIFLVVSFVSMTIIYFGSVFARFALNSGVPWAEEATRYINVGLVMLGSATVARHNDHTNISILELAAGRNGKYVQVLQQIITSIFFAISSVIGFQFAANASHVSPNMRMPMSFMYNIMSVAFLLIAFQAIVWCLNTLLVKESD